MRESQSKDKPLIQDSEYNIIHQLEKKADFLYSAMGKYIRDAEKDNKPELVKLWNTIKEDEQNHLKMLRKELIELVSENKFE
jgi:rubrerythrin